MEYAVTQAMCAGMQEEEPPDGGSSVLIGNR